jgi:hypothetical protein
VTPISAALVIVIAPFSTDDGPPRRRMSPSPHEWLSAGAGGAG